MNNHDSHICISINNDDNNSSIISSKNNGTTTATTTVINIMIILIIINIICPGSRRLRGPQAAHAAEGPPHYH